MVTPLHESQLADIGLRTTGCIMTGTIDIIRVSYQPKYPTGG